MDLSTAPVSVIIPQLQALSTFIQEKVQVVKVGMRIEEHTDTQNTTQALRYSYSRTNILFYAFVYPPSHNTQSTVSNIAGSVVQYINKWCNFLNNV